MATISTSGISAQQIIRSEHLLRIIGALDGTNANDIVIVGTLNNGFNTFATGSYSHAEGSDTISSGSYSHAEGYSSKAYGDYSHAEGGYFDVLLDTPFPGGTTTGLGSHAEGVNTTAIGVGSHAEGLGTIAQASYQHVQGRYNITSSVPYAFIHGNGTGTLNRSNLIFTSGSTFQVTGSLNVSGSTTINDILILTPRTTTPTGQPTGSFIVSGSGVNCKPYFYNGSTWTPLF